MTTLQNHALALKSALIIITTAFIATTAAIGCDDDDEKEGCVPGTTLGCPDGLVCEETVFGDGEQTRAFTYIGDVAPIIAKAPLVDEAYGEVFNIGSDKHYTINYLAKKVSEAMGSKIEIRYLPERKEVKHAYANHSKTKKFFSYCSKYSLEEGLGKMAEWAKEVGVKKANKFDNIEIMKNLPSSWLE